MIQHDIYFSFENEIQLEVVIFEFSQLFLNFSIIDVEGYYKGISEKSKLIRVIQLYDYDNTINLIIALIGKIKTICNQECVLHIRIPIDGSLV